MMNKKSNCLQAKQAFETRCHKATLVLDSPDVTIIDWEKADGGSDYYVRYILSRTDSRQNLLVMGDLGSACFEFWWNREDFTVQEFARRNPDANIEYFLEKLESSSDKYWYDYDLAETKLRNAMSEVDVSEDSPYDNYDVEEAISDAMSDFICPTGFGSKAYETISPYFDDLWEWFYDCGQTIHPRVYLWIVGLFMACKQLEKSD